MHLTQREGWVGQALPRIVSVCVGDAWTMVGVLEPWLNPAAELLSWRQVPEPKFWLALAGNFAKGDTAALTIDQWREAHSTLW